MSEHTPGEWRMTTPSCIWLGKRPVTLSYPGKMYEGSRAIVVQPTPYVERKANARLIAAAPKLLAALDNWPEMHYTLHGLNIDWDECQHPFCGQAREAIRGAKGEA